jgi:outer membrane protein assembly factor BamD (BamD/ComL family)
MGVALLNRPGISKSLEEYIFSCSFAMAATTGIIANQDRCVIEDYNMPEHKMRFIVITAAILLPALQVQTVTAETLRLEQGGDWKAASDTELDRYRLAVAEIKKLVNTGRAKDLLQAIDKLKKDFPQMAAPDLDAFIEAEILLCKGQFSGAAAAYEKFLAEYPDSELYDAAQDRLFSLATAFLTGQKKPILKVIKIKGYAEGVRIMERISERAGDAPIGVKAALAVAQSYEKRAKFEDAYDKWSQIASKWPTGQIAKDALLAMARCKHAAYQGPQYDSSSLLSAKSYYENFKSRYPEDAHQNDIDGRLKQIDEQLAYKQFSIGRYYQKTANMQSANLYYQMVIDNWPASIAAEKANQMLDNKTSVSEKAKE